MTTTTLSDPAPAAVTPKARARALLLRLTEAERNPALEPWALASLREETAAACVTAGVVEPWGCRAIERGHLTVTCLLLFALRCTILSRCPCCGRELSAELWPALELVGTQYGDGEGEIYEIRRCPCGTSRTVPVPGTWRGR